MGTVTGKMTIDGVKTGAGNALLKTLVCEGWKIASEYSPQMIDKGIDFDAYTLEHDSKRIEMEWDNWGEWTITGTEEAITKISNRLSQKE